MIIKWVVSMLLVLVICPNGRPQDELSGILDKLTGSAERTWIYSRFERYLGNSKCKAGESWTFNRDGRVVMKKCENGDVKSEEKRWVAEKKSSLDTAVKIGELEYLVLFPPPKKGSRLQALILRTKAKDKVTPTHDLIFYYEVD